MIISCNNTKCIITSLCSYDYTYPILTKQCVQNIMTIPYQITDRHCYNKKKNGLIILTTCLVAC